jgi:metal-responsive CopG/Arc/MetJ family transcriptional regulator
MQKTKTKPAMDAAAQSVRQSVSFPYQLHQMIEKIAGEKKVSLAWVIRDAVEKYAADQLSTLQKDVLGE